MCPTGSYPSPVTSKVSLSTTNFVTVISFFVNVPVLSVQITVAEPSVSTAGSLRISACRLAIRVTPNARVIVTTAGMVSTTWVQFIKGTMLVLLCAFITILILFRGVTTKPTDADGKELRILKRGVPAAEVFYSNPMKSRAYIEYAAAKGVDVLVHEVVSPEVEMRRAQTPDPEGIKRIIDHHAVDDRDPARRPVRGPGRPG